MAWKKVSPEQRRKMERAREIKKKAKNRKQGPDDAGRVAKDDEICAICDNGGGLVCCDGGCQRSFHLDETKCRLILGLTIDQAKMIDANKHKAFICKNCKYKQHQCFACGKLGSSDLSSGAEVFQCRRDDCARFYHLKCVAKLLNSEAKFLELEIAARQGYECPIHKCSVCKGEENKNDKSMQFAVCRRCPTTYHRKCLPSDILFEEGPNGEIQRAWEELEAPDGGVIRLDPILIYCTKHEIIENLGTPKMNHIVFPKTIREPKVLVGPTIEEDTPEEEEVPGHPLPEPSQLPSIEEDTPKEEELPEQPLPEPSQPPLFARNYNQCLCSSPFDSFAPSSLFPHPHPGNGGWLEE